MAKQKDLSETYIGESTTPKDIFKQFDENYQKKSIPNEKQNMLRHQLYINKSFTEINNYYFIPKEESKDFKDLEKSMLTYYKTLLSPSSQLNTSLHKEWWAKISTIDKIRHHPREFLSYGTFGLFLITLFLLLSGLLLNRIILMPDFGVTILIVSFIFWLMTQFSK